MCRRNQLRGALAIGAGLGLILGYSLDSWILCVLGGLGLLGLGILLMRRN